MILGSGGLKTRKKASESAIFDDRSIYSFKSFAAFSPRILRFSSSVMFSCLIRLTAFCMSVIWCGKSVPRRIFSAPE